MQRRNHILTTGPAIGAVFGRARALVLGSPGVYSRTSGEQRPYADARRQHY